MFENPIFSVRSPSRRERVEMANVGSGRRLPDIKDRRRIGHARHRGLTLLELMVTLAVLAILLSIGIPSLQSFFEGNRLKGAAQALAEDLQWSRSEAILRNRTLHLSFNAAAWCYGIAEQAGCDCAQTDPTASGACALSGPTAGSRVLKRVAAADFPGIAMTATIAETWFEPRRALARNGTLGFVSPSGTRLNVVLSRLGRVRICVPADAAGPMGYRPC